MLKRVMAIRIEFNWLFFGTLVPTQTLGILLGDASDCVWLHNKEFEWDLHRGRFFDSLGAAFSWLCDHRSCIWMTHDACWRTKNPYGRILTRFELKNPRLSWTCRWSCELVYLRCNGSSFEVRFLFWNSSLEFELWRGKEWMNNVDTAKSLESSVFPPGIYSHITHSQGHDRFRQSVKDLFLVKKKLWHS